jgi:hypothetical protein
MSGLLAAGGAAAAWDGSGTDLAVNAGVTLNPTANGNMVLAGYNVDTQNNAGQAFYTWGSNGYPLDLPALQNAPVILVQDFGGNGLTVTNISAQATIWVAAYGPGVGPDPQPLPADGVSYSLPPYQARSTVSSGGWQRLVLQADQGYTVFVLFVGNEVTTICVNAPTSVCGYDVSTPDNSYQLTQSFGGQTVWVINLSPSSSDLGQVSLTSL